MVVGVAFVVAGIAIGGGSSNSSASTLLASSAWFVVGSAIVVLRPGNAVGWLFSAIGLVWTSGLALAGYPEEADAGPFLTLASWYSELFWLAGLFMMVATLYRLPDRSCALAGLATSPRHLHRLRSRRGVYAALEPHRAGERHRPRSSGTRSALQGCRTSRRRLSSGTCCSFSDGRRGSRRSWFARRPLPGFPGGRAPAAEVVALAGPFALLGWTVAGILDGSDLLFIPPFIAIPVAAGIAILRYQLFDVDRLIEQNARLRRAHGAARRCLRRACAPRSVAVVVIRRRRESRNRGLDVARRGTVSPAPFTRPALRRPPLLPPPLRRATHARGLRGTAARAGRSGVAAIRPRLRRRRHDAAGAPVGVAATGSAR